MSDLHPVADQLLNIINDNSDIVGHPEWEKLEPEFNQALLKALAQAWQDGHDTALLNGQSSNPYKEDQS